MKDKKLAKYKITIRSIKTNTIYEINLLASDTKDAINKTNNICNVSPKDSSMFEVIEVKKLKTYTYKKDK